MAEAKERGGKNIRVDDDVYRELLERKASLERKIGRSASLGQTVRVLLRMGKKQ